MIAAFEWFWDKPSWNWCFLWAGIALMLPTAVSLLVRAFTKMRPRLIIDLVNGKDGRWSTSKTTQLFWTEAVLFAILAILFHTAGDLGEVFGDFQEEYLLVLGIPFGSALAAKVITSAHVDSGEVTTKAEAPPENNPVTGIAQVFTDDQERGDLLDTQYFLFNLVLLGWFLLTFFVQQVDELPDLPDTLLGLTSVSALAYVAKKGLEGEGGPTIRSVVPAKAPPGDRVKLRGVNFATTTQPNADVLFNGIAGTNPQVTVATTYAEIDVGIPQADPGIVELRVVAFDGRKSEPIDFEIA